MVVGDAVQVDESGELDFVLITAKLNQFPLTRIL
jgi:hypothetical protein